MGEGEGGGMRVKSVKGEGRGQGKGEDGRWWVRMGVRVGLKVRGRG